MEKVINHNHNGLDSSKIKVYNVIPTYEMTSAQLTKYLARPAVNGEEFNVYVSDTGASEKYVVINNEWTKVGGSIGCVVSDNLKYSLDEERTVNGLNGGYCKSIMISKIGNIRVKWDSHIRSGYSGQSAWLVKNGTRIQQATSNLNTAYQTYTFDTPVSIGDILSLEGENNDSANYIRYFRNFRIYYDDADVGDQTIKDENA